MPRKKRRRRYQGQLPITKGFCTLCEKIVPADPRDWDHAAGSRCPNCGNPLLRAKPRAFWPSTKRKEARMPKEENDA
jgi:hypothetical protein